MFNLKSIRWTLILIFIIFESITKAADFGCKADTFFNTLSAGGDLNPGDGGCTLQLSVPIIACVAQTCGGMTWTCTNNTYGGTITIASASDNTASCTVAFKTGINQSSFV